MQRVLPRLCCRSLHLDFAHASGSHPLRRVGYHVRAAASTPPSIRRSIHWSPLGSDGPACMSMPFYKHARRQLTNAKHRRSDAYSTRQYKLLQTRGQLGGSPAHQPLANMARYERWSQGGNSKNSAGRIQKHSPRIWGKLSADGIEPMQPLTDPPRHPMRGLIPGLFFNSGKPREPRFGQS